MEDDDDDEEEGGNNNEGDNDDEGFVRRAPKNKRSGGGIPTSITDGNGGGDDGPEGKYVKYGDPLGRPDRPDRPKRPPKMAKTADNWAPTTFTSSRTNRNPQQDSNEPMKKSASRYPSLPEDYMDDEDLEALGYAAGLKTKLPFASLQSNDNSSSSPHHLKQKTDSSSSFGLLLRNSLHEQLVTASQESIGLIHAFSHPKTPPTGHIKHD
jgi:hypothetical protein